MTPLSERQEYYTTLLKKCFLRIVMTPCLKDKSTTLRFPLEVLSRDRLTLPTVFWACRSFQKGGSLMSVHLDLWALPLKGRRLTVGAKIITS